MSWWRKETTQAEENRKELSGVKERLDIVEERVGGLAEARMSAMAAELSVMRRDANGEDS